MIDLHAHILPDLDDGARDVEASLAMARVAVADGIDTIFATPHSAPWGYQCSREEIADRVAALEAALRQEGVGIRVLSGLEAHITPNLVRLIEAGQYYTLNGSRYLLVELPHQSYPPYTDQVLFEVQLMGLVPIIAHPERNMVLQKQPRLLYELAERGIRSQVTAASLTGAFGSRARETGRLLVQNHLAQFIASDAHASGGSRGPVLSYAVAEAATLVGMDLARAMVTTAPAAVVENREFEWEEPQPPMRKRRLWAFWR